MGNIFVTDAKQGKVFKYVLSRSASLSVLAMLLESRAILQPREACRPTCWPLLPSVHLYVRFRLNGRTRIITEILGPDILAAPAGALLHGFLPVNCEDT